MGLFRKKENDKTKAIDQVLSSEKEEKDQTPEEVVTNSETQTVKKKKFSFGKKKTNKEEKEDNDNFINKIKSSFSDDEIKKLGSYEKPKSEAEKNIEESIKWTKKDKNTVLTMKILAGIFVFIAFFPYFLTLVDPKYESRANDRGNQKEQELPTTKMTCNKIDSSYKDYIENIKIVSTYAGDTSMLTLITYTYEGKTEEELEASKIDLASYNSFKGLDLPGVSARNNGLQYFVDIDFKSHGENRKQPILSAHSKNFHNQKTAYESSGFECSEADMGMQKYSPKELGKSDK